MCAFHPPFEGQDMESLYKKIKKGKYNPIPEIYSSELSEFIAYCLCKRVEERPSAEKLLNLKFVSKKRE
jgi:NIMA (never in mitosis gene a)-related kinase